MGLIDANAYLFESCVNSRIALTVALAFINLIMFADGNLILRLKRDCVMSQPRLFIQIYSRRNRCQLRNWNYRYCADI